MLYLLLYIVLIPSLIFSHGFAEQTLVLCNHRTFKHINHIKNKTKVYSYNANNNAYTNIAIKDRGYSTTNCYINLIINNNVFINCTPTQEFCNIKKEESPSSFYYDAAPRHSSMSDSGWVPAYNLTVGDQLLCVDGKSQLVTKI